MISLDQVLLLEEKVENAVRKIEQLNAENAALRRKCAELTNALAAKTEQFSSFLNDQSKIEDGILKALNRLDALENTVLSASSSVASQKVQKNSSEPEKTEENHNQAQISADSDNSLEENQACENLAEESQALNEKETESKTEKEIESVQSEQIENNAPSEPVLPEPVNTEKPAVLNENSSEENGAETSVSQAGGNTAENPEVQESDENVQPLTSVPAENLEINENLEKSQGDTSSQALFDIF